MLKLASGIARRFFVAAGIGLVLGSAMASESGSAPSAGIFLAGESAYRNFSKSVERQTMHSSELSIFLANMANYEITLREETNSYVVKFTPKRYMGHTLRGGGSEYKIDKKDFRVVDVVRSR